jgi:hypothetical protein
MTPPLPPGVAGTTSLRVLLVLAAVSLLIRTPVTAQQPAPTILTGQVTSGAPPRPVPGALVKAGAVAATTDADGRFTLRIPESLPSVHLTIDALGFLQHTADIPIISGRGAVEVALEPNPQYREEVQVSGRRAAAAAAPQRIELEPADILSVAGAVDNVFRVLQTMPGVTATDDFGSRLSVRGGGPDQNLTVMDGVEIHNPYRLFGLTSAFNPETVERFELTAGGFGPQYGDRLSSILTVDNRAGTPSQGFAGTASLSVTDANIVTEGRIPHGSWLVTGRRTYYDLFAERVTDSDLPSFADLQTKMAWEPRAGQQLTAFALRSRESTDASFEGDVPDDDNQITLKDVSSNDIVSLAYAAPIGRKVTTRTLVAYYRYADALDANGLVENRAVRSNSPDYGFGSAAIIFTRSLTVRDLSARQETRVAAGRHTVSAGAEAHVLRTSWGWRIAGDRNDEEPNGTSVLGGAALPDLLDSRADTTRLGSWAEDDVQLSAHVRVAGGLRIDWNSLTSETEVSPRLRATVDFGPRTRLRLAAGRYTQSPGYEKLLQADYFVDLSDTRALGLKSELSTHYISGLERELGGGTSIRIEGYYKAFDRLIVGRLESPEQTAARVAQYNFPAALQFSIPSSPEITSLPANVARGTSYGADIFVERRARSSRTPVSGWMSYTWGRALFDAYGRQYPFDYERRHATSLVGSWRMLPRVRLAATFRAASGFPDTRPIGLRVAAEQDPAVPKDAPGSLRPRIDPGSGLYMWGLDLGDLGNLNSTRLPVYARLDVRATYQPSPAGRWQFYLEVINLLNRDNAGQLTPELRYNPGSDRPLLTLTPDAALPRLPSFGIRIKL